MRWRSWALAAVLAVACVGHASANPQSAAVGCRDSGLITRGKLLTDFCWLCLFPIRIMGIPILGSPLDMPGGLTGPICKCPGRMGGIPAIGSTFGMWVPTHVHEITRQPFCSPVTGLNMASMLGSAIGMTGAMHGSAQGHTSGESGQVTNYYWHWIKMPTSYLWDLFGATVCTDPVPDADIGYMSEFDPTMWDDSLAMFTHPEAEIFAPIWAEAACIADGVVASLTRPLDGLFWCAGTWGRMYPFTPRHDSNESIEGTMLVATRGIAAMHRRGLAQKTTGPIGVCGFLPWFVIPKQQYKLQNLWPFPQRFKANWIGRTGWRMGPFRKTPVHEDRVVSQFTFRECCVTYW